MISPPIVLHFKTLPKVGMLYHTNLNNIIDKTNAIRNSYTYTYVGTYMLKKLGNTSRMLNLCIDFEMQLQIPYKVM